MRLIWVLLLLCFRILCVPASAQPVIPENAPEQRNKPYVLLISFDGFRYDFIDRFNMPNMRAFAAQGVRAKALRPSFPANTFPNHYTIVSGLYPDHHGIVDNVFLDEPRDYLRFRYTGPDTVEKGTFYGGTPLWNLAEKQGMRTASYFWPGTGHPIQGAAPSAAFAYDGTVTTDQKIKQVIEWFRLPQERRPHFVSVYFPTMDTVGHRNGPDSKEVRDVVEEYDVHFGELLQGLRETGVPINIFVVGDHGSIATKSVYTFRRSEFPGFEILDDGATQVMFYAKDKSLVEPAYRKLRAIHDPRWTVYKRGHFPKGMHYGNSDRVGDIVMVAKVPVALKGLADGAPVPKVSFAEHGYFVKWIPEMRTVFYAQGPNLKEHKKIGEVENINIYPFLAELLGLKVPQGIDGKAGPLRGILKK